MLRQYLTQTQGPLLLDGAMGTMIQTFDLTDADFMQHQGDNDLLSLTRPDVIAEIHRRYLAAGADIITTNTFNAQRISQADYGCEHLVVQMNEAAVKVAREAIDTFKLDCGADKPRFIAGSVGPTNKSLSISPDMSDPAFRAITFDEMVEAYVEQMRALIRSGVDALLIETCFDTLNAKAALYAAEKSMAEEGRRVELMLSATISDKAGRLLSGQTLEAFVTSVSHAPLLSIGLNCSFGAEMLLPFVKALRARVHYYISLYPNAGLPNEMGEYEQTPEQMAEHMRPLIEEGIADIVGGCCGTTDKHIAALAQLVKTCNKEATPRHAPRAEKTDHLLHLSGLEAMTLTPDVAFVNVGERCNVAGSRKFLRLIKEKQYDVAIEIARQQVQDGAMVLDINLDDGLLDTESEMRHFLNLLAAEPDICSVPFMIDSSDWQVIRTALTCIQGKAIVNSISLKEGEQRFIAQAREIRMLGAAVIVMAFDEQGQATTYERRIEICRRAYEILTKEVNFPPEDIIFDPNILAIATGMAEHDRYALDFIRATEWIHLNLPYAHVSGGVSNLSFAFRGNDILRQSMHAVFLYHARLVGMDMAILNPATRVSYADVSAEHLKVIEDAILCRRSDAAERLLALASQMTAGDGLANVHETDKQMAGAETSAVASVEDRLVLALRRGVSDHLEEDIKEALAAYQSPVAIIEGPLMKGMNLVGQLFGEGKMFLPQVVKAARTMKQAVRLLQPAMEAERAKQTAVKDQQASKQPCVLLATVKGDVHDIGKNIVATVMACNGFQVVDLGVMVEPEVIVAKAKELHPDIIGLSGLITPSLSAMTATAKCLDAEGLDVPLMIGGATTSELHTALHIAPYYKGPVIHVKDASQNVVLASQFLSEHTRKEAFMNLMTTQQQLRQQYQKSQPEITAIDEARANKPKFF